MQRSWEIEEFFDEDGLFFEEEFMKSVDEFVRDYVRR